MMISTRLIRIITAFVTFAISSIDLGLSQEEGKPAVFDAKIVVDAALATPVEDTKVDAAELRKEAERAWQLELKNIAHGEIVFARLACRLTPDQVDRLMKSIQPRLQAMNELIDFESNGAMLILGLVDEIEIVKAQPVELAEVVVDGGDEARQMEKELDEVQVDLAIEDVSPILASSGNGIPLKENPFARLRREFRDTLKEIANVEQIENYDRECLARDEYRVETAINLVMGNLRKSLLLESNQESQIRSVLSDRINQSGDFDLNSYLFDTSTVPTLDVAKVQRFLTVRQRAKWNTLTLYDYPIQVPYIAPEPAVDE